VKDWSQRLDREVSDGYERQAVITAVAYYQGQAGLWAESDALLQSNLARSHSPYYLMSQLGGNAKKQGKKDEALRWYQQAYEQSVGPATRLQWGAGYVTNLVDLAPQDAPRIEKAVQSVMADAAKDKNAFYDRSARSMQRIGKKLAEWNGKGERAASMKRLQAQWQQLCGRVSADQKAACQGAAVPLATAKG
jgi:hypothetical protein